MRLPVPVLRGHRMSTGTPDTGTPDTGTPDTVDPGDPRDGVLVTRRQRDAVLAVLPYAVRMLAAGDDAGRAAFAEAVAEAVVAATTPRMRWVVGVRAESPDGAGGVRLDSLVHGPYASRAAAEKALEWALVPHAPGTAAARVLPMAPTPSRIAVERDARRRLVERPAGGTELSVPRPAKDPAVEAAASAARTRAADAIRAAEDARLAALAAPVALADPDAAAGAVPDGAASAAATP